MENTQLTPFLTHKPFSALTSFLGIPLEAQTIAGVLQAPDTLYSHQKMKNYSINIAHLAINLSPKKAAPSIHPI